jgi:hypothetical protein
MGKQLVLLIIIAFLLSGCIGPVPEKSQPGRPAISPNPEKEIRDVYLYFVDKNFEQLVPEKREVVVEHKLERTLLEELIKGPENPELAATLPEDINIISVDTIEGLVYVNFSRDLPLKLREKGMKTEEAAIKSILYTLTELPEVKGVQILIEGDKQPTLAGYVNIREPLKREIITGEFFYKPSYLQAIQERIRNKQEQWRLSPMEVVKIEGRIAGFLPTDSFEGLTYREDGSVSIEATHEGKVYKVFLKQPMKGEDSFWVISRVEADFTPIPPLNYSLGERFIRGIVQEVRPKENVLVIERIYTDTPDTKIEAGPEISLLHDAIIHIQKIIGYKNNNVPVFKEEDGSLEDIKPGYEVGLIITQKKKARAVIATPVD